MAGYGYSTYSISMRSQIVGGPVRKPFAPFVPSSQFNGNDPSEGYVTKKKIVPVSGRPHDDNSDDESDDERKHQRQTSPVLGHPSNGYGDYRGNKQPIGATFNKQDGYNNGANYGKKEGTKSSSGGAIKNDNHDAYNNAYGYGGRRPNESSIRPTNKYDGTNYGYGGNTEGRNPIGDSINYDCTDYGGNKEGPNRIEIPVTKDKYDGGFGNPAKKDNYGAYGGHGKPSGPKPTQGRLSKATNDIEEAIEILKREAANREHEYDKSPHHQRRYDGPGPLPSIPVQPKPGKVDKKGMDLVNETERLKKINVKDAPQPRPSLPRFNFSGGVINHKEAEKRFNGMTI